MNQQFFINYINTLEGCKTKCKNFHWAATNLPIHEKLDDFLDELGEYQDAVAEGYMGILGKMSVNVVNGNFPSVNSPLEMIDVLSDKVELFYDQLPENSTYSGLKSETDSFIQTIKKYNYLFTLAGW